MGSAARAPGQTIALPQGGGALRGLGEKFTPDPFTGTGGLTVPLAVPPGRNGFQPHLVLTYSTGARNGVFGLGWSLGVPNVSRQTSHGVPRYADDLDTFVLSGTEDLVPVEEFEPGVTQYRPRTEGVFAQILHRADRRAGIDKWEVASNDGLVSTYATPVRDPRRPDRIFAWELSRTEDLFGNLITYDYVPDEGEAAGHRWSQPLLRTISYADSTPGEPLRFLATVTFDYGQRDDAFSDYRSGFEIRTSRLCRSITTATHADRDRLVRRYELVYANDPYNRVSLLSAVNVVGFDDDGAEHRDLPALELQYSQFQPAARQLHAIRGSDLPVASLARPGFEVVDLTGDGKPDVLELDGVSRYWRNLGGGVLDAPRQLRDLPAGLSLGQQGVQLLDADGDSRPDLVVTAGGVSGYFPLRRDARWERFRPWTAPSFDLEDPQVRLLDLDRNGVTDVLHSGTRLECFLNDPEEGWSAPIPATTEDPRGLPDVSFDDQRVKLADMSGDELQDLVLVHDRSVVYWPNLGRGRWGTRIRMTASPALPAAYDPARLLLGDLDGDGVADLAYVADDRVLVWINRSGNSWSEPVVIQGTPVVGGADSVRIVDLLGTGVNGILWSRDAPSPTRPSMHFLDLSAGVKPRLLTAATNNIGATTHVTYAPSSRFASADNADPRFRWRTTLPFVVPVVARVEVIDAVSRAKLATEFRYHSGYWDGQEREFRGFGCVEQLNTETFDVYHREQRTTAGFRAVERHEFSPPTLTRTWFHLGPVSQVDGRWRELDWSGTYWEGDPSLLRHTEAVHDFLDALGEPAGPARDRTARDALRTLRGRVLRTEYYALDGTELEQRPYTVTEHAYGLRKEYDGVGVDGRSVFFPHLVASRTTQWERGGDPMTEALFVGDYDEYGNPRQHTSVALPRRLRRRRPLTAAHVGEAEVDETRILATHMRTEFATSPPQHTMRDRVACVRTFELRAPPTVDEQAPDDVRSVLIDQFRTARSVRDRFERLSSDDVRVIGDVINHYDGEGFVGLRVGELGEFGALTRSESLILTDEILTNAYGDRRPAYLGGNQALPADAPGEFETRIGYRLEREGGAFVAGYYGDTLRREYDFQASTGDDALPARGLVVGIQDPLGRETRVLPDRFWLLTGAVVDAAGLETTVVNDYRVSQPRAVTDPNGHTTHYRYHPLGILSAEFLEGRDGEGGSEEEPETRYDYDFLAFARDPNQPIYAHTARRVHHASDAISDQAVVSREYSDGLGRPIQVRMSAEELGFGDTGDDVGLSTAYAAGLSPPAPVIEGVRVLDRVVVSGWQVYDNKGQVVERFEPLFSRGWRFQPEAEARRGRVVWTYYDPLGRVVRTINPDGSQSRMVFGLPEDLARPDVVAPTPWEFTTYDPNDLAPLARRPSGDGGSESLADEAPVPHHFTPTTAIVDGRRRTRTRLVRNGADPSDWYVTRTEYDLRNNVVRVTDPLGRVACSYAFDLANRPLGLDSIDAGWRTSVLAADGNVIETRDDRGAVTLLTYDALNRLDRVHARDNTIGSVTVREAVTYGDGGGPDQPREERARAREANRLGRTWRHLDEAGELRIDRYDFKGNVVEKTRFAVRDAALAGGWNANWADPEAGAALESRGEETVRRFDALNRLTAMTTPADASGARAEIAPSYGPSGLVLTMALDGRPYVAAVAYNARGQRVFAAFGNGIMTRYAYDADTFRLVQMRTEGYERRGDTFEARGPPLQALTYDYDLAGNLTSIEDRTAGCGVGGSREGRDRLVREFRHDALYRLVEATGRECTDLPSPRPEGEVARCGVYATPFVAGPGAPNQDNAPDLTSLYTETYDYDALGNLVELHHLAHVPGRQSQWRRQFGIGGRPPAEWQQARDNRATSLVQGGTSAILAYDPSGNLASHDLTRSFQWDHGGRLVGFSVATGDETSVNARYLYGADGARVKKWVRRGRSSANDESIVYVDGVFERHSWSVGAGGETAWVHLGIDAAKPVLVRRGAAHPDDASPPIRYQFADHLGSVAIVVDDERLWVNREELFPGGEPSFGGFRRKRFRHTGKERDEESGLQYHGDRYYSPSLHRWTSVEPLLTVPPTSGCDATSPYAYVDGRWMTANDPDGQAINLAAAGIGAAAGFVLGGAFELGRQWIKNEPLNLNRAGAVAVGGAVAGGLAGLTMGTSLLLEAGAAGVGSVAGGTTTRALLGERTTGGDMMFDFAVGVVTFGIVKGAVVLKNGSSNETMKRALLELESAGERTVPSAATPLQGAAFYSEVLAEDFRRGVVNAMPEPGVPPAEIGETVVELARRRAPVKVGAGVDRTTGEIRYGVSGEGKVLPPEMPTPLQSLERGASGEPIAVNQCSEPAIGVRQLKGGGKVTNLAVTVLETESGKLAPACCNCQVTMAGAEFTAGVKQ